MGGVDELIRMVAKAVPDEVGGPISILALDKNGTQGVPGHQGVSPISNQNQANTKNQTMISGRKSGHVLR